MTRFAMVVALRTVSALALVICPVLTGCLVSFEDYPLGALGGPNGSLAGSSDAPDGSDAAGGLDEGSSDAGGSDAGDAGGGSAGAIDPSELMIDDFEDGDGQVLPNAGRNGSWFVLNDSVGIQTPDTHTAVLPLLLAPARGASTRGLHTSGSGFTIWGALIGANFVVNGTIAAPYDISAHEGVTFWAKLGKATATKDMRVSIRTYETLYGCTSCGDHFGSVVALSDSFQSFQLPFSSMKQVGWGRPQAMKFDLAQAYALTFGWGIDESFDVWIDDVSFY